MVFIQEKNSHSWKMVVSLRDMVMLLQALAVWPMSNVLNLPYEMVRLPFGQMAFPQSKCVEL
jgi:hypothetical protein